jgi:hypothetical protein
VLWAAGGVATSALATILFFAGRGAPPAQQVPGPPPALSKSAQPPQAAPVQAPPAETPAVVEVPVPPTLGEGKLGRKASKSNAAKVGRGDPFGKSASKSGALFDEPFLDVKNAQPAPMQQKPAPATQQAIPLLKSASKPKANDEQQLLAPTTGAKAKPIKRTSKGGKAFPAKDFDPSLK